jgi:hypothetical protein
VVLVRRLIAILSLSMLLGVAAPSSAMARGPKWEYLPLGPLTLPDSCSFPVVVEVLTNKEFGKATENPDGSIDLRITGSLIQEATNPDTGESVVMNTSGPGTLHFLPDGSLTATTQGHTFEFFDSADAEALGLPSPIFVWAGQTYFTVGTNGIVTGATLRGHMLLDVCAELS